MTLFTSCANGTLVATALLLCACAPSVSVSDLSKPNFGLRVLPHLDASVDPDPAAIANGLYSSRPLQGSCLAYFGCSSQSPVEWSGWSP